MLVAAHPRAHRQAKAVTCGFEPQGALLSGTADLPEQHSKALF
jgi:hypothetical protein